jgi:uncharacterized protein YbbC (DUF1343 family)/CubicO group peptidase (beta-lactamase class C family)
MAHNLAANSLFTPRRLAAVLLLAALAPLPASTQKKPPAGPDFSAADRAIEQAIAQNEVPGAVLLVGHNGRAIYRKAYGARALVPAREAMTVDTIFDIASLTKVFATAPSILLLIERGQVRLSDPVARYIPEFGTKGKDQINVRHLLTHVGGLPAIPHVPDGASTDVVLRSIYDAELVSPPGARFLYSDCDFIVLGELVRRVSGMPLDEFARKNLFVPLGMIETRFLPPANWKPRIAPTEEIDLPEGAKPGSGKGRVLRGVVHDPRARGMGGVAGHAGLFSTANDLASFCRMLLAGGVTPQGKRLFSVEILDKATSPQTPPWSPTLRGLGWDIDSSYSAPRGELFSDHSYGHTGFTGTSVWIDPLTNTFVILLANSVHPSIRPPISSLRSRVSTAVAAAIERASPFGRVRRAPTPSESALWRGIGAARPTWRDGKTRTGIDVLVDQQFASLRGLRVGLITNHTGVARDGKTTVELLAHAEGVHLVALLSPEHGLAGRADEKVASTTDPATGLPVYSLFGDTRRPTEEMLGGLDALVFDIQDAGVRFYTYPTTMAYAMEEAAKRKLAFFVLDRPNPLGGDVVAGPVLDADKLSFVGYFPMPVRHGMTVGELARMYNEEKHLGADLRVIAMQDWRRSDYFASTGLVWIPPSPNLRSLDEALLYPGVEILQAGGVSVGRGTDRPFELLGAPWIHATELAAYMNRRFVSGVRFVPTRFTPRSGLYKDETCEGIELMITDRRSLFSMLLGVELAEALAKLYPGRFEVGKIIELLGSAATLERIQRGDAPSRIVEDWADELAAFRRLRAKYLLYQ